MPGSSAGSELVENLDTSKEAVGVIKLCTDLSVQVNEPSVCLTCFETSKDTLQKLLA